MEKGKCKQDAGFTLMMIGEKMLRGMITISTQMAKCKQAVGSSWMALGIISNQMALDDLVNFLKLEGRNISLQQMERC